MTELGFKLYMVFVMSWYLHLPARIPLLGLLRFDIILFAMIAFLIFSETSGKIQTDNNKIQSSLKIFIIYIILTLPFVEWPGTVVKGGLLQFLKASFFFYFTIAFITSEKRLKVLLSVFLICQIYRVLEPLYLHITQGYWGGKASMVGGEGLEFMNRLSGSPYDIVGANGLAFIIVSIIPFLYYLSAISWKHKLIFWSLLPPLVYALILTASRSGIIGLLIFVIYLIYKSDKKHLIVPVVIIAGAIVFINLPSDMQDRYASIFSSQAKNSATAQQRLDMPIEMSKLILRKPLFGYGLGTSLEANAHYGTLFLLPHNLFVELGIEVGLIGMVLFLLFIKSIIHELFRTHSLLKDRFEERLFLLKCSEAILILLIMNLVFTMASYGLLESTWYFIGGLVVVLKRLSDEQVAILKKS